jgi:hypothetical protein
MAIENMMFKYGYDDDSTPAEVKNVRQSVFDYMYRYGNPVVIKRIYNTDDVARGITEWDSTFDDVYEQSSTVGPNLGFSAGWSDGFFTYLTLGDGNMMIDDDSPNRTGSFKMFVTSGIAPWNPIIQDGDLIITTRVEISNQGAITITGTGDRFRVQKVFLVPLRAELNRGYMNSETNYVENPDIVVSQNFEAVRIPRSDPLYEIGINTGTTIPGNNYGDGWQYV